MERWGVGSQRELRWRWPDSVLQPLTAAMVRREELVSAKLPIETVPIIGKISFGGEIFVTSPSERRGYKGRLFWARSGDLIYSRIRVKQGSMAIVPPRMAELAVSNEYPVFSVREAVAERDYLALVLRSQAFGHYLDGLSHGSSTKTRVLPESFETIRIPLPPLATQRAIVAQWQKSQSEIAAARARAAALETTARAAFLASLGLCEPTAVPTPMYEVLQPPAVH